MAKEAMIGGEMLQIHEHTVESFVDAGNTQWRCSECGIQIHGSVAEFPGKSARQVMSIMFQALPDG